MKPIAEVIADNLISLRKKHNLTQNDLANKLKYSDNTVSRWEHAEITPSVETLEKIAEIYDVPLESLLKENVTQVVDKQDRAQKVGRICSALLIVMTGWLLATIIFVYAQTILHTNFWTIFIWALPASCIILFPFNSNRIYRFVVATVFVWTFLLSCFLQYFNYHLWLIFLTGIPVQLALAIWAFIKPKKDKK
jgi:transcriptional regulator with XRE-family HTH domain